MKNKILPTKTMESIRPERVQWLWPGRIPYGKLTILQGDPGVGKSTIALDIAARITRGSIMPDATYPDAPGPQCIVLLSGEDGLADTVRNRLEMAGADLGKVYVLDEREHVSLPSKAMTLCDTIASKGARLLVLDPLACFLDQSVNSWNNQSVRGALSPLAQRAAESRFAVLIVDHLNKRSGVSAMQRGSGSIGINAAARSVLLAARHPEEQDTCVLASVKNNLSSAPKSLRYFIRSGGSGSGIMWGESCPLTADELVALPDLGAHRKLEEAKSYLLKRLQDGPVASCVIQQEASQLGLKKRTIDRARGELGVVSRPHGHQGEWMLSLPLPSDASFSADGTVQSLP